jgi:hypothetical protein
MEHAAWLFGEARERQRRRQRRLLATLVAAVAVIGAAAWISTRPGPSTPAQPPISTPPGTAAVGAGSVFAQDPYMGVHCPAANSIACDRVGLAIWLKRPAIAVTATINGRRLAMNRVGDRLVAGNRARTEFDGYLQPAGLRTSLGVRPIAGTDLWDGDSTPYPLVWLLIDYGRGRHAITHLRVPLSAGWG